LGLLPCCSALFWPVLFLQRMKTPPRALASRGFPQRRKRDQGACTVQPFAAIFARCCGARPSWALARPFWCSPISRCSPRSAPQQRTLWWRAWLAHHTLAPLALLALLAPQQFDTALVTASSACSLSCSHGAPCPAACPHRRNPDH
jgi:hypothetical protein